MNYVLKKKKKFQLNVETGGRLPSSYIPSAESNGDYISQLKLYTRECLQFTDFISGMG